MDKVSVQNSLLNIYTNNVKPTVDKAIQVGSIRKANQSNRDAIITAEKNSNATLLKNQPNAKAITFLNKPQQYDILDLSELSKKLSDEIDKLQQVRKGNNIPIQDVFDMYPEISDEYLISLLALGESVPKPDESLDGLQWSTLIQLGNEIGMTDPNGLLQLTDVDLEIYFDLKYNKTDMFFDKLGDKDQFCNTFKLYEKPEDVWKDIFELDVFGEFKRGNGGALIRNEDFVFTSSTVNTELVDKSKFLIKDFSPATMLESTLTINSGNRALMNHFRISSYEKNIPEAWYTNHDYKSMDKEARLLQYKRTLVGGYEFTLYHVRTSGPVADDNHEALIKKKINNAQWVTFKPFQGNGIFDVIEKTDDIYTYEYRLKSNNIIPSSVDKPSDL